MTPAVPGCIELRSKIKANATMPADNTGLRGVKRKGGGNEYAHPWGLRWGTPGTPLAMAGRRDHHDEAPSTPLAMAGRQAHDDEPPSAEKEKDDCGARVGPPPALAAARRRRTNQGDDGAEQEGKAAMHRKKGPPGVGCAKQTGRKAADDKELGSKASREGQDIFADMSAGEQLLTEGGPLRSVQC